MKINFVSIAIILVVCVIIGLGFMQIFNGIQHQVLGPIHEANQSLQTQVAKILNPTPTIIPDPVTIINKISSLARLETIQYTVEKIIVAEKGQEVFRLLFGDRLLFVAHGKVIAGIDLTRLNRSDLEIKNGLLKVTLPETEIFIVSLDNEKSYTYSRDTGLLTKSDLNLETLARRAAETEILQAALDDGILKQARVNAEAYLLGFLNNLGFNSVAFVQTPPPAASTSTAVP
jgi:hypothetical protein